MPVRELENVIGHMVRPTSSTYRTFRQYLQSASEVCVAPPERARDTEVATLEGQERRLIRRALEQAGGNQSKAVRLLRMDRDAQRARQPRILISG